MIHHDSYQKNSRFLSRIHRFVAKVTSFPLGSWSFARLVLCSLGPLGPGFCLPGHSGLLVPFPWSSGPLVPWSFWLAGPLGLLVAWSPHFVLWSWPALNGDLAGCFVALELRHPFDLHVFSTWAPQVSERMTTDDLHGKCMKKKDVLFSQKVLM